MTSDADGPIRLHVQCPPDDARFAVTRAQLDAALARQPGDLAARVRATIADDDAGFAAALPEAEVLLTWTREGRARLVPLGAEGLRALAPRLRIVAFTSAGVERLAPFDWVPEGVTVLNNRGTHSAKAGEFGVMAILMLRNHVPFFAEAMREGRWEPRYASTLAGETLGVVGVGGLGGAVATRARAFGMRVVGVRGGEPRPHEGCDEVVSEADLDAVLPRCAFLFLACPLTERTRGLLSRARVALLPSGACVINIARAGVWDEAAVCDALDAGHLAYALTDVADPEPLPPDSRLWRTRGLFVTPHMSSDDPATYNDRTLDILLDNLRAEAEGRPMPNRVDPARGY